MSGEGHQYTDQIRDLKQAMAKFEQSVERLSSDVRDIKQALLGTEFGEDGIVKRQAKLEKDIDELKRWKQKVYYYVVGFGAGAGVAVSSAVEILFG